MEEAEELKEFDDPHGEGAAFEEQSRAFDEQLREAGDDPKKAAAPVPIDRAIDSNGNIAPVTATFEEVAQEIEAGEDFLTGLSGCLR